MATLRKKATPAAAAAPEAKTADFSCIALRPIVSKMTPRNDQYLRLWRIVKKGVRQKPDAEMIKEFSTVLRDEHNAIQVHLKSMLKELK